MTSYTLEISLNDKIHEGRAFDLVKINDERRKRINDRLKDANARIFLSNGTRWARAVVFIKDEKPQRTTELVDEAELYSFLLGLENGLRLEHRGEE